MHVSFGHVSFVHVSFGHVSFGHVSFGLIFEIKHPLQQLHSKKGVGLRIFEGGPILGGYFLHYSLYQFMTYSTG